MLTKNPEVGEAILTQAQSAALPMLATGAKKKDAAAAAGVCPQTVSTWLQEPHFSAALRAQREQLAGLAVDRMREVTGVAVATVVALMESGSETVRLKAATYFLDRVVLLAAGDSVFDAPADRAGIRDLLIGLGVNC